MSRVSVSSALVFAALAACSSGEEASAVETLMLASISGEEDSISRSEAAPDDHLPFERTCDAPGAFDELFAMYDEDRSGALGKGESDDARADWPVNRHQMMMLDVLHLVYDTDSSGELDDPERAVLLDDFTVRCEVMQARVIAEFDLDGDGALSDTEAETAHQTLEARRPEAQAELEERCEGAGGGAAEGEEGAGDAARRGGPGAGGEPPPSPLAAEFDTDGDGSLSDTERATLVTTVRERIRAGEMPVAPPEGTP